ncbi:MAG: ABC transporter ATP-binding protein [Myxococcota bacterium]
MIKVREVGVQLDGRWVLDGVDLDAAEGSLTVLVGPNGAGKSTLLDVVRGWRRPARGRVQVAGRSLAGLSPKARAAEVAWLAQHPRVHDVMTVTEWLGTARFRFGESPTVALPAIAEALAEVGMGWAIDRSAHTLSGGEAQRVAVAALVAQEARVWLLDEPTHHLDPAAVQAILGVLKARLRGGQTMVLVAHQLDEITSGLEPSDLERVVVVGLREGTRRFALPLDDPDTVAVALSDLYDVRVDAVRLAGRVRFVVVP